LLHAGAPEGSGRELGWPAARDARRLRPRWLRRLMAPAGARGGRGGRVSLKRRSELIAGEL